MANPIDPTALEAMLAMVGGDQAFVADLIDTYLADSPALFADLHKAFATNDAVLLRRIAHTLKSNSENFGATQLAAIARALEERGKQNEFSQVSDLITTAATEYARVEAALIAARPG
jgi:HPt (histidine-containing phosphotransfer) domain-containing protein